MNAWQSLIEAQHPRHGGVTAPALATGEHLAVIHAEGEEAGDYLQGQLTADLKPVDEGAHRAAMHLSLKGRGLISLRIARVEGGYLLLVPAGQVDATIRCLEKYRLRAKVTFRPDPDTLVAQLSGGVDATLAEAGLPIHITEVTFAAPAEPEHRAAQAEAIMRIWWGHPAVEEIILWNFWNPLGPRSHLNLGIFGDDRNPTRHGEALLSLLNDRWRTDVQGTTGADGALELRATHGQYLAQWDTGAGPVHVRFEVLPGPGTLDVVALQEPAMP